jgi:FemAB family
MSSYSVAVIGCGSQEHLADLKALRERQLAIPHHYSAWPLHCSVGSWVWCRISGVDGRFVTGFAIQLTSSRALPGTRIGQIDYLGRSLHEEIGPAMGIVLKDVARKIPRLQRLEARVFDEDPVRRQTLCDSLRAAGWSPGKRRQYSHTLIVPLADSEAAVNKTFSTRVRSTIRKALESPLLRFAPVTGAEYSARIAHLHSLPFLRTGGVPQPIDVKGILSDASDGNSSLLIGAFAADGKAPEDLLALAWARLHGDHAILEINASERSEAFSHLSPGFGLMSHLFAWAIQHGARWVDMGGLSTTQPAADDPMRGIIEFKMRFSSDFREVAEEWQIEPNPLLAGAAWAMRRVAKSVREATRGAAERGE